VLRGEFMFAVFVSKIVRKISLFFRRRHGEFEPRRLRSRVAKAERDFATLSPASKRSAQEVTFGKYGERPPGEFPESKARLISRVEKLMGAV
jgi:hypothetical protein